MYEVTDMYFVASLIAYGANYVGVDRADKRNQKFIFKDPLEVSRIYTLKSGEIVELDDPEFDDIKHAFDTVSLMCPPNYIEALRRVKGIIHT